MATREKKTILIVEDDMVAAMGEADIIKRFGYDVLVTENGDSAIKIATGTSHVDLVLMDIDLGKGIDGTEAARQILEKKNIPIVFLTAHAEQKMVERVQGITRYGYVIKNSGSFVLQSSIEMAFELFEAHQQISQSEARLRTLVQTIPDLIWLKDADGVYLSCNPRFEEFFGAREADIVGKTDYDFVNKDMADFFRDNDRKAMSAGEPIVNEEWITYARDGRRALLETIKTPMKDKDEQLIGVLGIGRDITSRKAAEEALRASERRMKAIVDGSPIPQFVIDRNHHITHWNRSLEEYSGIKSEDVIGTNQHWRAFYSYERPCMADLLLDGLTGRISQWYAGKYSPSKLIRDAFEAIDFFPAMRGGTWLYFTAAPIYDPDGDIIGAVETLSDVTDRMRAEDALKLNNLRLDTLLKVNQMTDEPVGEIMRYVFEEAVRLTKSEIGYLGRMNEDETEMEVTAWSRNVMPECRTAEKTLRFPVASAGLWAEAVRQRRPIVTNDYAASNPWKKGCPAGHITIKRHMNVPIMIGSKIAIIAGVGNKAEDYDETDVRQLTLLMEGMLRIIERKHAEDSLRDSLAEKDVILRELYHRTKNNMQVIYSMLNLKAVEIKDPMVLELYRDIQKKIQTMALVHQKLYDSKDLFNLNLSEYAGSVVELMLMNNELLPGRVKIHQSVAAIPISIDTAMPLGLVLNELISNSLKHAFPDNSMGEIWINIHPDNDMIMLAYRDSGIGLPAGFDPDKAKTLGMSIIRNLSRMQLGGNIRFAEGPGFICEIAIQTNLYKRRI